MSREFVVVKFGSELVTSDTGIDQEAVDQYVNGLVTIHNPRDLVVVTSGAVAAGRRLESRRGKDTRVYSKAVLAQIGGNAIMHAWESAFDMQGVSAGGLYVTHHELEDGEEGASFINHLHAARRHGVVSIINENDALSNQELMKLAGGADNDALAGHIARAISAVSLTLFTKRGGVVDDDHNLIPVIDEFNIGTVEKMLQLREQNKSQEGEGRGGIVSKVEAAWATAKEGVGTRIAAVNMDMTGAEVTEFVIG